jgi:hypothetical protein
MYQYWLQLITDICGKDFLLVICSLYNNVLPPSKLGTGTDFHCFKAGIEPKWEDPKCAHGGKWTASPNRSGGGGGKGALDIFWLHTVLHLIFLCIWFLQTLEYVLFVVQCNSCHSVVYMCYIKRKEG